MKTIFLHELQELINSKGNYILIDVREVDELAYGIIPTSICIPLSTFTDIIDLDETEFKHKYHCNKPIKTDNIILYCRSGVRSAQAAAFLEAHGFTATNYKGSILEWSTIDSSVKRY